MDKTEVERLATLARIELTETEINSFTKDISGILSYVAQVQDMTDTEDKDESEVGARYNVFRKDIVTNEPDSYTEELLSEMPEKQGRYMEVKKILKTDTE